MLAGLTAQLSRSASNPDALPLAPDAVRTPPRSTGGVIWITGVASMARADLVGTLHRQLDTWWNVEVIAPDALQRWLQSADESGVAIVIANGTIAASGDARRQVSGTDRAFIEILAVSDWDALVERTDSTLFEHLADFFAHLGHPPAPRRPVTRPEAVIRLDWDGPKQIAARLTDALQRAGLLGAP